jgi:hypothetical protein
MCQQCFNKVKENIYATLVVFLTNLYHTGTYSRRLVPATFAHFPGSGFGYPAPGGIDWAGCRADS